MATVNQLGIGLSGSTGSVNFVGSTSATLITPTLGAATGTTIVFNPTTGGMIGTTTNDSAASGIVGEFINSTIDSTGAVSLSTGTSKTITSITLSAGDWNIWSNIIFIPGVTTTITVLALGINTTTNVLPSDSPGNSSYTAFNVIFSTGGSQYFCCNRSRVSIAGNTIYYMVANAAFATSTMTAYGSISARRIR